MLEALIVWENVILYSIDPIRRSASQPLVVLLHPGDKIVEFFGLPGLHVAWAVSVMESGWVWRVKAVVAVVIELLGEVSCVLRVR